MKPMRDIYGLDLSALNGAPLGLRPTPECPGARLRLTQHDARRARDRRRSAPMAPRSLHEGYGDARVRCDAFVESGLLACPARPVMYGLCVSCQRAEEYNRAMLRERQRIGRPMTSAGSADVAASADHQPHRHRRRARQPRARVRALRGAQPPRRWPAGRLPRVHRCRPYRDRGPPREGVQGGRHDPPSRTGDVRVVLDIRTVTEGNAREGWRTAPRPQHAPEGQGGQGAADAFWRPGGGPGTRHPCHLAALVVTLTRISTGRASTHRQPASESEHVVDAITMVLKSARPGSGTDVAVADQRRVAQEPDALRRRGAHISSGLGLVRTDTQVLCAGYPALL